MRTMALLRLTLILAFALSIGGLSAQTTRDYFSRPGLGNGAFYYYFFSGYSNYSWHYVKDTVLCGDTLLLYESLRNANDVRYLHIQGGQVFGRHGYLPCSPGWLLYNFDLEPGDTVIIGGLFLRVIEKDYRSLLNGENRRFMELSTLNNQIVRWIEGIGDMAKGVFPAQGIEGGSVFVCARDSSGILWTNPAYASQCDSLLCPVPITRFGFTVDQETVSFQNATLNGASWLWEFGDGNTSTLPNPEHTYDAPGCYEVALTAFADCRQNGFRSTSTVPVCIDPAWSPHPTPPPTPEGQNITGIHFVTPDLGWVIARNSIWKTADGGQTWEQQFYPLTLPPVVRVLNSIHMLDDQTGIIGCGHFNSSSGNLPGILLTRDGGQTWEERGENLYFILNVLLTADGHAFATRQYTTLDYSSDGGETWVRRHTPGLTLSRFQYMGNNTIYASAYTGLPPNHTPVFAKSFDAGLTWQTFPSAGGIGYFLNLDEGWSHGGPGELLHTTDGGHTWQTYHFGENKTINRIFFADAQNGWAVGSAGLILHTTDGGANWRRENCGYQHIVNHLSVPAPDRAFASGNVNSLLQYTPGLQPECSTVNTAEHGHSLLPKLSLAPNPASYLLNVQLQGEIGLLPADRLLVFNILGQTLLSRDCHDSPNLQMDVSALPEGTYVLVVLRNNKMLDRGRFVVVR